jgi:dTDP-4-amino-4,6-dideoxygalactose transaminase
MTMRKPEIKKLFVTQPLMPPLVDFIPYLEKIWLNKWVTNGGEFHNQLERELCTYLGVSHLSLFNNGTTALLTAIKALDIGGEVITTPFSFVATSHALLWNGLTPVFVDIDPLTFNLAPDQIAAAITPRTCAILPVHCYGFPCDIAAIGAIAERFALKVVYDAAHAFATRYRGQSVLNYGDLAVLSFHATKPFNTFEGGAIVSRDTRTKQRLDCLKDFGIEDEVTVAMTGINGKMNEISAAFGLLQLTAIEDALARRRVLGERYCAGLAGVPGIRCIAESWQGGGNYAYFPIEVGAAFPLDRDALFERLRAADIIARRYFYPLISDMPMYRQLPSAAPEKLPVAHRAAAQVICLPIYPALTDADVDRVIGVIAFA